MINQGVLQQISSQINEDEIMQNPERKKEVIKIILQTLENLGYDDTFKILQNESQVKLYNDNFSIFKQQIMDGNFEQALSKVEHLNMTAENQKQASFLVLKQKYMEILEQGNIQDALQILRTQLIKYSDQPQLNALSSYMVYAQNPEMLKRKSNWTGQGKQSRKQLILQIQNECQPQDTMNSNFMEKILKESILFQILKCPKHSQETNIEYSLMEDHCCQDERIPDTCISLLKGHHEEVWIAKFSNQGNHIASVSKNNTLIVWNFDVKTLDARMHKKILKIHDKDVYSLQWSQQDKKIITSSADKTVKLWNAEKGTLQNTLKGHQDIVCSAIYHPFNHKIYTGGIDNYIIVWNQMGQKEDQFESPRISDMIFSNDGQHLLILCASFKKINIINTQTKKIAYTIEEKDNIISISLSNDDKLLLVNTSYKNPELHLYNLETLQIVNHFDGYIQEKFLVKCLIGGPNHSYISCGSEDGRVMIWHKLNNKKSYSIQAHKLPVNSLSFNPKNPSILLTSSDDESIKIWAPKDLVFECQKSIINSDIEDEDEDEDEEQQQQQLLSRNRLQLDQELQRQQFNHQELQRQQANHQRQLILQLQLEQRNQSQNQNLPIQVNLDEENVEGEDCEEEYEEEETEGEEEIEEDEEEEEEDEDQDDVGEDEIEFQNQMNQFIQQNQQNIQDQNQSQEQSQQQQQEQQHQQNQNQDQSQN